MTDAKPVIPLDTLGPVPYGVGALPVGSVPPGYHTDIEGEPFAPAPMIPPEIELSDRQRMDLANYLYQEMWACESERNPQILKISRLKQKYRTDRPDTPKNFPIANSSQITIPVIKTAVDATASRVYQTLMAAEPPVRVKTDDEDYADFAEDLEKFLGLYAANRLDYDEVMDTFTTECVKLGTSFLEVTTLNDRRAVVEFDPSLGVYNKVIQTRFSGPIIYNIPYEDFWCRPAYQDIQKAPWCGKEVRLTWPQIKDMAMQGDFNPTEVNKIRRFYETGFVPQTILDDEKQERSVPWARYIYRIFEIALRWDVDGDGIEEELLVYFHRESRTLLRCKFSGFAGGRRPWEVGRFKKIEYRLYGEGLAETLEQLQDEISTIHNQRIDNATIANLKIILVSKLIQGLRPGDRLWTGKIVKVTDVKADVGTLGLGEIYPSTVQNEEIAQQYVREVAATSEVATGTAQPVTRTTAAAQLALLEELNRRFDKSIRGMRRTIRGVFTQMTDLFKQFGTGGLASQWLGDFKGQRLEAFLQLPGSLLDQKIKIHVQATRSGNNREVDFQTQIAVMQLVIQMGQQAIQLVQGLAPQATGVVAHELVQTLIPIFKKVMQYADAPDPDKAIAVLSVLDRILPSPEDMGGMAAAQGASNADMVAQLLAKGGGGQPNGSGPAPATQSGPGMGSLLQAFTASGRRG